jgi:hypothetical protein
MHPEIIRAVAAQQINEWIAAAEANERSRRVRHPGQASRTHRPIRLWHRTVAAGRQATRSA